MGSYRFKNDVNHRMYYGSVQPKPNVCQLNVLGTVWLDEVLAVFDVLQSRFGWRGWKDF